jgi:hypothetical protein
VDGEPPALHRLVRSPVADENMKTLTKELWLEVPQRRAIVSIHDDIERLVAESGVTDGLALINPNQILDARLQRHINWGSTTGHQVH